MKNLKLTVQNLLYLIRLSAADCPRMLLVNTSFGAVVALQTVMFIIMPKLILDAIIYGKDYKMAILLMIAMAVAEGFCYYCLTFFSELSAIYNDKMTHDMLLRLSQKATRINYSDIKRNELIEKYRLAQNVTFGMEYRVAILFCDFFSNIIKLFTIVAVISFVNGWMALVILLLIGFKLVLVDYSNKKAMEFRARDESENVKYSYVTELCAKLAFAKEVRTYDVESFAFEKYKASRDQKFQIAKEQMTVGNKTGFGENFADVLMVVIAYAMIVNRYVKGLISISSFTMYLTALGEAYDTVSQILKTITDLSDTNRLVQQYREFIEYPEEMRHTSKNCQLAAENNDLVIEFKNVSFRYPNSEQYALQNVNAVLHTGEKIGIVGENGAGKTTFVNLLLRLYDVQEGEILLNGINIKDYDYDEYMRIFSVVPQNYALFFFGIGENIGFEKCETETEGVKKSLQQVALLEKVEKLPFKYNTFLSKWFSKGLDFSGGERQRFAIARGLFRNSNILVMDEPNSAIDPIAEQIINESVKEVSENRIVLNISHRLSTTKWCDKIFVFDQGRLAENGSHSELMEKNGIYRDMYSLQAQYYQ